MKTFFSILQLNYFFILVSIFSIRTPYTPPSQKKKLATHGLGRERTYKDVPKRLFLGGKGGNSIFLSENLNIFPTENSVFQ